MTEQPLALISSLDRAYGALKEARNDFERLRIRDKAQAAVAAAAVLKRRDIQVEASVLVAEAERTIAEANPPRERRRNDSGIFTTVIANHVGRNAIHGIEESNNAWTNRGQDQNAPQPEEMPALSEDSIRQIRLAHGSITDQQFAEIAQQAREQGEPLTRAKLKQMGRKLNPSPEPTTHNSAPPRLSPKDQWLLLEEALRAEVEEQAEEIGELKERIRFLEGELSEWPHEREAAFNGYRAQIATLRSQVNEWITKHGDERRRANWWERQAKTHGWRPSNNAADVVPSEPPSQLPSMMALPTLDEATAYEEDEYWGEGYLESLPPHDPPDPEGERKEMESSDGFGQPPTEADGGSPPPPYQPPAVAGAASGGYPSVADYQRCPTHRLIIPPDQRCARCPATWGGFTLGEMLVTDEGELVLFHGPADDGVRACVGADSGLGRVVPMELERLSRREGS